MAKAELGNKHLCNSCNTKFYDLQKEVPICPKCGEEIIIIIKPRLGRPPLNKKPNPEPPPVKEVIKAPVLEDDDGLDNEIEDLVSLEDLDEDLISNNNEIDIEEDNNDDSDNLSEITDLNVHNKEEDSDV
jgi:uncharacterized protein (TIGR02300 family)